MNALILYRSYYGNCRRVAEEVQRQLRALGHEAAVQDLRARLPDLAGFDRAFLGAPTRLARVTGRAKGALRRLKAGGWGRKPLAVFDTYGPLPKTPEEMAKAERWLNPGAAGILARKASQLGLNVHPQTLRCVVREMKGPLADGELEKVGPFLKSFLAG
jgi:hypothetical protein